MKIHYDTMNIGDIFPIETPISSGFPLATFDEIGRLSPGRSGLHPGGIRHGPQFRHEFLPLLHRIRTSGSSGVHGVGLTQRWTPPPRYLLKEVVIPQSKNDMP